MFGFFLFMCAGIVPIWSSHLVPLVMVSRFSLQVEPGWDQPTSCT